MEPGEDDVSAWCKLHGAEFKGEKIPFGAWFTSSQVEQGPMNRLTSLTPRASLVSLLDMKSHRASLGEGNTWLGHAWAFSDMT